MSTVTDNTISESTAVLPTRADIEAMKDKITLADSENGLELYCYNNCEDSDSELVKNCRGVVLFEDRVVLRGFPFTPEFVADGSEKTRDKLLELLPNISDVYFCEAYEGCVLRLFNFQDKWYLTTRRKLNADKSRWASKTSFGELFEEALAWEYHNNPEFKATPELSNVGGERVMVEIEEPEDKPIISPELLTALSGGDMISTRDLIANNPELGRHFTRKFYDTLDKDCQYFFLLRNSAENRIVCDPPKENEPRLYHVGTVKGVEKVEHDIAIARPKKLTNINTVDQLLEQVKSISPWKLQGILAFDRRSGEPICKVNQQDYAYLAELRGNEPSVKFRYLHVRMDADKNEHLRELYPEYVAQMDEQEKFIFQASQIICSAYINKYIRGQRIVVPPAEFAVMREAHNWYKRDGLKRRMSYEVIIEILNKMKPTELNRIIKDLRMGVLDNIDEPKPVTAKRNFEPKPLLAAFVRGASVQPPPAPSVRDESHKLKQPVARPNKGGSRQTSTKGSPNQNRPPTPFPTV